MKRILTAAVLAATLTAGGCASLTTAVRTTTGERVQIDPETIDGNTARETGTGDLVSIDPSTVETVDTIAGLGPDELAATGGTIGTMFGGPGVGAAISGAIVAAFGVGGLFRKRRK